MRQLQSYLAGQWIAGSGRAQELVNPATEEALAGTSADGLDLAGGLAFARSRGGAALRAMTLGERAARLAAMAQKLHGVRDELLDLAQQNGGNTRGDAKFDVDGAAGALAAYAELGAALGDQRFLVDGEMIQLGRSPRLCGRHVWSPRRGVALLINAFNFPAWGFAEKAACALLAGVPVVVKPATSTALVAHRLVEVVAGELPEGAISLVCGSAHELPALLEYGDVIAFTGSSDTAQKLRELPGVKSAAVRLNVEADSLNVAVLGADVEAGSDTYQAFVRDVAREVTQKTGQKCTAVRRILVPGGLRERVVEDLVGALSELRVGDPAAEGVRMGPLSSAQQLRDVRAGIEALAAEGAVLLDGRNVAAAGAAAGKGYFVGPTLLEARDPGAARFHELEVFGPVASLLASPTDPEAAAELCARGRGGLVGALYSDDRAFAGAFVAAAAPHHGRLVVTSHKIADTALSPGMALPQLLHGGPGRAGDGVELGGLRGLALYSQRTAIQGERTLLESLFGK